MEGESFKTEFEILILAMNIYRLLQNYQWTNHHWLAMVLPLSNQS
jgi:hypothetical protein